MEKNLTGVYTIFDNNLIVPLAKELNKGRTYWSKINKKRQLLFEFSR